jgi:serine/threonine protein phosphatase PrpC
MLRMRATRAAGLFAAAAGLAGTPRGLRHASSQPAPTPLRFLAAGTCLAHPEKERGEDAFFTSPRALGVADGVGGWKEKGIDSGVYSRSLMEALAAECADALAGGAPPEPLPVLQAAHASVRAQGSSTALLVVAGSDGKLRSINVGDCSAQLWRRARPAEPMRLSLEEAGRLWSCDETARISTHGFNIPRQLAASRHSDHPSRGHQAAWAAQGGELLLLASDGVWDNLGEAAVRALLSRFDFTPCLAFARLQRARYEQAAALAAAAGSAGAPPLGIAQGGPGKPLETRYPVAPPQPISHLEMKERERLCLGQLAGMSAALAMAAQKVGADPDAVTPFSKAAYAEGHVDFTGGKLDDATVVCALVTADPEAFDVYQ